MPYLGVAPNPRENREVDDISSGFNGGTTQFTLQSGGSNVSPGKDTAIIVSLGGVVQNPGTDYTIAASTITFTTAPASGLSFFGVVLAQSIDIETTADNTVTTAKIVDGAVTNAKVNASAAIAGTKVSPDFGSQAISTTGGLNINGATVFNESGADVDFRIEGDDDTRLFFLDAGTNKIGIGVDSAPLSKLHVQDVEGTTLTLGNTAAAASDGDYLSGIDFHIKDNNDTTGATCASIRTFADQNHTASAKGTALAFFTVDDDTTTLDERLRITQNGNVGIGTTAPSDKLHVRGASAAFTAFILDNATNSSSPYKITFGDQGQVNHLAVANREITFGTNNTERMRIDASGNLLLGNTSYNAGAFGGSGRGINIAQAQPQILLHETDTDKDGYLGLANSIFRLTTADSIPITFATADIERMRIDSDGRVNINTTSGISAGLVNINYDRNTFHGLNFKKTSGAGTNIGFLNHNSTFIGSIASDDSSTAFNTSSDYRLKENAVAISDGITRLKTLKPYKFNWIVDETNTLVDGFFAHEVSDAVPEAVTGTKDQVATDSDVGHTKGDPIYQQIDQSKLVPLLTAALQEAITKIETLETKVAALEAA